MIFFVMGRIFSLLLDLITIVSRSDHEKDLEILLLRQQMRILQRKHPSPPRLSRWEKFGLAVLAARLIARSRTGRNRLAQAVLVFKPDTLCKWHRELVRRKWTFTRRQSPGRPSITTDTEALILRLAKENPVVATSLIRSEHTADAAHGRSGSTLRHAQHLAGHSCRSFKLARWDYHRW